MAWCWKGRRIEEVKEYKYLGYNLRANGRQEGHLKERVRKAALVMGKVWSIGKKRCKREWGRRAWLFNRLVWPFVAYKAEVWGWAERKKVERMQERYLRWILGVDRCTPGYMVREETQRLKLNMRASKQAWKYV